MDVRSRLMGPPFASSSQSGMPSTMFLSMQGSMEASVLFSSLFRGSRLEVLTFALLHSPHARWPCV